MPFLPFPISFILPKMKLLGFYSQWIWMSMSCSCLTMTCVVFLFGFSHTTTYNVNLFHPQACPPLPAPPSSVSFSSPKIDVYFDVPMYTPCKSFDVDILLCFLIIWSMELLLPFNQHYMNCLVYGDKKSFTEHKIFFT